MDSRIPSIHHKFTLNSRLELRQSKTPSITNKAIRDAGGLPFILSNVPQGLFSSETSNNVYGIARNPWNHLFTTGGSSGGEAGLISSFSSPIGVCSDSAGSVRGPAANCGVTSFKPTARRISRLGRVGVSGTEAEPFREVNPIF